MNKLGILVFYIKNLKPEMVEVYRKMLFPEKENFMDNPLNFWKIIYLPINDGESRIQIIRNQNGLDLDNLSIECLNEIKEVLKKYES